MCGIFGGVGNGPHLEKDVLELSFYSKRRGADSSGFVFKDQKGYQIVRSDTHIELLRKKVSIPVTSVLAGHSRLVTNGHFDNQPVVRENIIVLHNGIIVNESEVWAKIDRLPKLEIDSETLPAIAEYVLTASGEVAQIASKVLELCEGVVNCAMFIPGQGKLLLISNNGSLFTGIKGANFFFASEAYWLKSIGCEEVTQVTQPVVREIPPSGAAPELRDLVRARNNLVPSMPQLSIEEDLLTLKTQDLVRCSRCILPVTMPFINFDQGGVCNYCRNYSRQLATRPLEELFELIAPYRRLSGRDTIIPFSGGRDSSFGLHIAAEQLGLRPIAYTYDWGMVTDLARRNISRMCASLGIEHIVVAANIEKKRANIRMNLEAWLKSPHLGMISVLTAGDKHAFKFVETVRKESGVKLNLWSVTPLETTHFKAGFLGIPPNFAETRVYRSGASQQFRYQSKRFQAMLKSPGYFNSSLWDTLSGEISRTKQKKDGYFHLFDYVRWNEDEIGTVLSSYDWEKAEDTTTTWRIGDGTAAFYNYIYGRVAGFTEHDTFRSNQIREGELSREKALALVEIENRPRYQNIKWYLDALGMEFSSTIERINSIPQLGPHFEVAPGLEAG